ncbi:MAG: hypothetical protein KGZ79_08505 [Dethiobacter sp.]|jgi:hypothetical protein|nr:hypothetical protein [Dethiobacter sp.]
MTNTLHRRGTPEGLQEDFIVFALTAKGHNRKDAAPKIKKFIELALKHNPNSISSSSFYSYETGTDWSKVYDGVVDNSHAAANFSDLRSVKNFISVLKEADLGICINVSGLLEQVRQCCSEVGISRHSVEHSLGIIGKRDMLPNNQVLELNTMCGHGMVSFNLIAKVIEHVKLGKIDVKKGALLLAKPCMCGAFNTVRAAKLLDMARDSF